MRAYNRAVRKLVSTLLLLLLPFYLSSAAVAALCLPGAAFVAHAHGGGAGAAHPHDHHAHDQHAHDHHAAATHAHHPAAHADADAGSPASALGIQAEGDTGWPADGSGCCHAAASALPTQHALRFSPPALPGLVAPAPQLVASHLAEGLFRPPRAVLA